MAKFVSGIALYQMIQQKSSVAKEILWVCSPCLGLDAHEILSQEIIKNPPTDIRFVFTINEVTVKKGEANPFEVQYFMEHFQNASVKTSDAFHSNIYLFDNSALFASADLTKPAFESSMEAGVLLEEETQVNEAKAFFNTLWENAKPVKDIKKFKKIWNTEKKVEPPRQQKASKPQAKIEPWKDDVVDTWYFAIPSAITKRTMRKIQKETGWPKNLELIVDLGPNIFRQVKLGDIALIADLTKKRESSTKVRFARIFDKSKVETEEGDLHFACETKKTYQIDRNKFYEMLKNAGIAAKSSEILLTKDQTKIITTILSSTKTKRKHKQRTKVKAPQNP
jgi:hypothetical protein